MALETIELDKKMLEYSLSQFRNNPEYAKICEAFAIGLGTIQNSVNYLSDMLDIDLVEGVWLKYLNALMGEFSFSDPIVDIYKYFSVNATNNYVILQGWNANDETVYTVNEEPSADEDVYSTTDYNIIGKVSSYSNNTIEVILTGEETSEIYNKSTTKTVRKGDVNVSKFFCFPNLSVLKTESVQKGIDLNLSYSDELLRLQTKAKIAYNNSKGTREDLIKIIKPLVNADHVIIHKVYDEITGDLIPMQLSFLLYGTDIIQTNLKSRIETVLPNGVGVYGNIEILEISYTDIEININEIVDMNYISPLDQDYTYEDINDDLNEILEMSDD